MRIICLIRLWINSQKMNGRMDIFRKIEQQHAFPWQPYHKSTWCSVRREKSAMVVQSSGHLDLLIPLPVIFSCHSNLRIRPTKIILHTGRVTEEQWNVITAIHKEEIMWVSSSLINQEQRCIDFDGCHFQHFLSLEVLGFIKENQFRF